MTTQVLPSPMSCSHSSPSLPALAPFSAFIASCRCCAARASVSGSPTGWRLLEPCQPRTFNGPTVASAAFSHISYSSLSPVRCALAALANLSPARIAIGRRISQLVCKADLLSLALLLSTHRSAVSAAAVENALQASHCSIAAAFLQAGVGFEVRVGITNMVSRNTLT
jgi:hypothetical protein